MPATTETWEVKLADSILGVLFLGARKGGRGSWLTFLETPERVRSYLLLKAIPGRAGNVVVSPEVGKNLDELEITMNLQGTDRFGQRRGNQATIWVEVEKPPPPRPKRTIPRGVPAIRNLEDLMDHFGADNPDQLNRRIYRHTEAGASISVQTPDELWHHNGQDWSGIDEIISFTIQTIIEGSDAEINSDPFILPVTKAEVDNWISEMEHTADDLWREANEPEKPEEPIGMLEWWPEN